jgi:hypothetical protein
MPAYNKGNVIRGGFGSTFRRIVCHANCRDAETCELRNVCPYTAVFQPFVPEGSEKISKNRDIPRPFIVAEIFPMRRELKEKDDRGPATEDRGRRDFPNAEGTERTMTGDGRPETDQSRRDFPHEEELKGKSSLRISKFPRALARLETTHHNSLLWKLHG